MKLSVIIPTYNRVDLLREAIESVLVCPGDCEILVCDDGSTDSTVSLCEGYARAGKHVILSRSDRNGGAQVARNRGIRAATGDYFLFMDSDDVMAGSGFAVLVDELRRDSSLGYVFGKVEKVDHLLRPLPVPRTVGAAFNDSPRDLAGYHWHTMGAVYRREVIEAVGLWNEDLTGSQDWEFQARVKLYGGKGRFIDTLVGYWRQHDGERVGAGKFRPDYVKSVMIACRTILGLARESGRWDAALEERIAKKLMLHALEWGMNDHPQERAECLNLAKLSLSGSAGLRCLISLAEYFPPRFDRIVWRSFVSR